jgi:hypothetical protein
VNVDIQSDEFGSIRPWVSLTDEQRASGAWVRLPNGDAEPRERHEELKRVVENINAQLARIAELEKPVSVAPPQENQT